MSPRPLLSLVLAGALAVALAVTGRAEPLPAPTEELRDFQGRGVIFLSLPSAPPGPDQSPDVITPGISLWVDVRQSYVRPDRILQDLNVLGSRTVVLVQGNTELAYTPGGYLIERVYKNVDHAAETPMTAVQMSMATYARLLREVTTGRLLPEEDLKKLESERKIRIAQLDRERKSLTRQEDLPLYQTLSMEMARMRADLDQLPVRREHACYLVEFDNKDVIQNLFARGLTGNRNADLLMKGKSTFWVTRGTGLPIKIETTDNEGRVAISVHFTEMRINHSLRPGDLALNTPAGTPRIIAMADVKERNWEEKLGKDVAQQLSRLEEARLRRLAPQQQRPTSRGGGFSPTPAQPQPEPDRKKKRRK